MSKKTYNERTRIKKTIIGIMGMVFLFYLVSCSATEDTAPAVEQTTAPAPPGSLRKINTCDKTTSVDLAWDASPGATSYKLYQGDTEIINSNIISYTDTGLTAGKEYTYKVQACSTNGCSGDSDSLAITTLSDKSFKSIIDSGRVPTALTGYDERSREIFSYFQGNEGKPLVAKYLKPDGADTKDGSSFDDAAKNLGTILDEITVVDPNKVYFIFLTGGNYKAGREMSMKQNTAIIGGVDECLNPSDTVTALDGDGRHRVFNNNAGNIGFLYEVTVTNGNAVQGGGMYNTSGSVPILVKVTFSGNSANDGGGMYNQNASPSLKWVAFSGNNATGLGGGMYNISTSSPSLEEVIFSNNNAVNGGGGMYNEFNSSPSLVDVTFSGNKANQGGGMYNISFSSPSLERVDFFGNSATTGGGMHNQNSSSPSLVGVTFSGNHATGSGGAGGGMNNISSSPILEGVTFSENTAGRQGGGMNNMSSSPILEGVTFSENTADKLGGGMYNFGSSPSLVGVTFSGNHATNYGGGMYNNNNGKPGPRIINGIFWGNTASTDGSQFYFENYSEAQENLPQENLHIYNSIVEGGVGTLVSGTANTNLNQGGFVSGGGLFFSQRTDPVVISFSNIIADNPGLGDLADNGGEVLTHAITSTSPAKDKGLYVKRKVTTVDDKTEYTFFYSADNSTWYTEPDLSGTSVTPPADAEDVTDATGYTPTDQPDLGAYEAR